MQLIKNSKNLIIISLILSIIFLTIAYPGIMYTDSYARIDAVEVIKGSLKSKIVNFHIVLSEEQPVYHMRLTPIPTIFIGICILLTGNVTFYAMCQSFF